MRTMIELASLANALDVAGWALMLLGFAGMGGLLRDGRSSRDSR